MQESRQIVGKKEAQREKESARIWRHPRIRQERNLDLAGKKFRQRKQPITPSNETRYRVTTYQRPIKRCRLCRQSEIKL